MSSNLDQQQIIQKVYDETENRLRVDASLTASIIAPPGLEVSIQSPDDNIAIRNSNNNNELLVNSDGSINVNTSGGGSSDINLAKVAGTSTSVDNGTSDSGTQRVVIASNNTPFSVNINSVSNVLSVTGPLTDTQLRASAVPINGTITANAGTGTFLVDGSAHTQPISGTVIANAGTGNFTVVQSTGTNLHTVVDSGSITINNSSGASAVNIQDGGNSITVDGSVSATQSGTWNIGTVSTITNVVHVDDNGGSLTVDGTVTANIGTTNGLALDASVTGLQVAQSSTTSGQSGNLVQSATTTNAPSYTTAKTNPLSTDTSGLLRVSLKDTPANTNAFKVDGSATIQPVSGTVAVTQSTSPWVTSDTATGTTETTSPTKAMLSGAKFNTSPTTLTNGQMGELQLDSAQNLLIKVNTALPTGTNSIGQVTANAGTNLNTSALALDTTVSALQVSQASTTSGQKGTLIQGAVTTSSPSYTNAQTDPLSLSTAGALRIDLNQINDTTLLAGNGVTGAGSPRVTISSDNTAFNIKTNQAAKASYVCNTGTITGATATGVKSLSYLWHPSTVGLRYQLTRININQIAGNGGSQRIELNRITAENNTPGGTTGTSNPKDADDAATGATIRIAPTGAPTRLSGILVGADMPIRADGNAQIPSIECVEAQENKPFVMRATTNEGYEVVQNVITTISTAPTFNISWEWTET